MKPAPKIDKDIFYAKVGIAFVFAMITAYHLFLFLLEYRILNF